MVTVLLIVIFAFSASALEIGASFKYIADILQHSCVNLAPTPYTDLHLALVCGMDQLAPATRALWTSSGLIHLLVVSGTHLTFLSTILSLVRAPNFLISIVLILFTLLSGIQPPCLRALLAVLLAPHHKFLGWSIVGVHFRASLLCCALYPQWWNSWSLQLSTLAGMAIVTKIPATIKNSYVTEKQSSASTLHSQVLLSVLLAPLLGGNTLWPSMWIANLVLVVLVGGFLFPLSVLSFLIGGALFSVFMNYVFAALHVLAPLADTTAISQPGAWGTIYVIFVYLYLEYGNKNK